MEPLGICADRMSERADVAGQKKIEGLDLIGILLAFIQCGQWPQNFRTDDSHAPNGWNAFEIQILCGNLQAIADYFLPHLRDPLAVVAL